MKIKKGLKYLLLLSLMIGIGLLFGFTNARNSGKQIANIHVDFEDGKMNFLSEFMVNKLLIQNKNSIQNQAKSELDLYRLEKSVLENPYVEKASVFTTINGDLYTTVKERTPIARVLSDTKSYYLDKKGVRFPLSENYSARVPLVSGIIKGDSIEKIHQFMRFIDEDEFLKNEVVGVHKKSVNDFELIVRSAEFRIEFGDLKNVEQKFRNLKAFYGANLENKIIFNYKTINLKFHNQVVGIK